MRVLIHGGARALGSIAVQLAKQHGAHATATASGRGVELVASLGADEVIDYRKQRFEAQAREEDIVLDTLGGPT
jgi:NADPH:quinone reductase-like Zn-dependent oxidoreductase